MRDLYNGGNADRIEKRKKAQHPAAGLKPTASRFLFCWCGLYHWATTSALISGISLTSPNFPKVVKPNFSSRDRNSGDTKSWNWMKNFIRNEMSATNPRSGQLRSCQQSAFLRECLCTYSPSLLGPPPRQKSVSLNPYFWIWPWEEQLKRCFTKHFFLYKITEKSSRWLETRAEVFVDRKQIQIRKLTRRQVRQNKILNERK